MAKNTKNLLKFEMLKSCKTFSLIQNYSVTYFQTVEEVPWLLRLKKFKLQKISKKHEKKQHVLLKKIAKICDIKKLKNYSMPIRSLSINYYQPPEEFFCPLGLERPE